MELLTKLLSPRSHRKQQSFRNTPGNDSSPNGSTSPKGRNDRNQSPRNKPSTGSTSNQSNSATKPSQLSAHGNELCNTVNLQQSQQQFGAQYNNQPTAMGQPPFMPGSGNPQESQQQFGAQYNNQPSTLGQPPFIPGSGNKQQSQQQFGTQYMHRSHTDNQDQYQSSNQSSVPLNQFILNPHSSSDPYSHSISSLNSSTRLTHPSTPSPVMSGPTFGLSVDVGGDIVHETLPVTSSSIAPITLNLSPRNSLPCNCGRNNTINYTGFSGNSPRRSPCRRHLSHIKTQSPRSQGLHRQGSLSGLNTIAHISSPLNNNRNSSFRGSVLSNWVANSTQSCDVKQEETHFQKLNVL